MASSIRDAFLPLIPELKLRQEARREALRADRRQARAEAREAGKAKEALRAAKRSERRAARQVAAHERREALKAAFAKAAEGRPKWVQVASRVLLIHPDEVARRPRKAVLGALPTWALVDLYCPDPFWEGVIWENLFHEGEELISREFLEKILRGTSWKKLQEAFSRWCQLENRPPEWEPYAAWKFFISGVYTGGKKFFPLAGRVSHIQGILEHGPAPETLSEEDLDAYVRHPGEFRLSELLESAEDRKNLAVLQEYLERQRETYLPEEFREITANQILSRWKTHKDVRFRLEGQEWSSPDGKMAARFLPRTDIRGLLAGDITDCCQHPIGAGSEAAWDAVRQPSTGNLAFFRKGRIVAFTWVWEAQDGSMVLDSIEYLSSRYMPEVAQALAAFAKQLRCEGVSTFWVGGYSEAELASQVRVLAGLLGSPRWVKASQEGASLNGETLQGPNLVPSGELPKPVFWMGYSDLHYNIVRFD
jgi:hypothetical protein